MAVQKSKKSPSRRGMRRSHDALSSHAISTESKTGELHLRNNISPDGYYKGNKVIDVKSDQEVEEDSE